MTTPLRILIVEDEALVARDLQTTLVKLGYAVVKVVGTAAEAMAAARTSSPDLALLDISFAEGADGIGIARELQEAHQVPVVFLTSQVDARTIHCAKEAQPYGCLLKPFHESELRSVIELAAARHQAHRSTVKQGANLQNTLRSIPEGIIATDLLGAITFMNPMAETLTGWVLADALARPLTDVFQITQPTGEVLELLPFGAPTARSIVLTKRDGATSYIQDTTAAIREPDGTLSGIVVLFRPRAAMEATEEESRTLSMAPTNDSNLTNLVHSLTDPLMACDSSWRITYLNPQAAEVLQAPREQLLGQSFWDFLPPSVHQRYYHEFSQTLAKGKASVFEMELDSTQQWFEVQLNPYGAGLLAVGRDITARKQSEEKERKLEKLESLGLLARGFAHDFNNLLTVLLGNISLAEMQTAAEAPGYNELLTAKQATLQAQGLVQHLLIFARGGVPVKQVTDFGRFVREWINEWLRRDGITYHIEIDPQLMLTEIDRQQFSRLLHNLFRNAEQSIRQTGTITLRLRPAQENIPNTPTDPGSNQWIVMELSDTGCGIPLADQSRVFEPYFTTRDEDHATGLGLTVCESIAKAHGATLHLVSTPGEGTTLSLKLPIYHPPVIEIRPDRLDVEVSQPTSPKGPRRVLILEDEPLIRQLMSATLKSIGCEVDQTIDGADTIARYSEAMDQGSPYQLLIMDLSIPNGMGGLQAMDQILQKDPQARAIVSSGYCDDPVLSRYMDYGFRAVLPKPYQPQELQRMVETMLTE